MRGLIAARPWCCGAPVGALLGLAEGELGAAVTWMGRDIERVWEASESVRAAAELEIALLLYGRERRLLAVTGASEHARAMQEAESQARYWLQQASGHVGGAPEASLLDAVRRSWCC